ncbi:MAG TPA: hypothetical protein VFG33_25780 [Kribbella sp.]|uniref:hypothetical protein n=1 Tax=Kribbella sp. TaxID=1871183 RepID=UPI002D76A223|nr:hypothetical protein [Kribbella sp.]HET6296824.1 hypothetical protein [Kribbella sp.]
MTDDGVQLIVVDAANVVGSRPDGWWRDRAGAARRLLVKLTKLEFRLDEPAEVVVVLEGAARAALDAGSAAGTGSASGARGGSGSAAGSGGGEVDPELGDLRVVAASGSGDDAIVAVVAEAVAADSHRTITVVTADRGLRDRVEEHGARTVGPRWLWNYLDE